MAAPVPAAPARAALAPPAAAAVAAAERRAKAQRRLLGYQKYVQEKFWRYRNGDDTYTRDMDQILELFHQHMNRRGNNWVDHFRSIRARQVPRVNYRGLDKDTKRRLNEQWAELNREFYTAPNDDPPGGNLGWRRRRDAVNEFHRAAAMITVRRNFKFVKVLGAGGNGMVVLWRWTPPRTRGVVYDVVMKVDINDSPESIANENSIMETYNRAPHIAQVFEFRPQLELLKRTTREQFQMADALDDPNSGVLFMEFSKLGDLGTWLKKLSVAIIVLPPEALWRIFDCLVKACKAMMYPPRSVAINRANAIRRAPPPPWIGPPLPEDIPPGGLAAPSGGFLGLVHFDLDPKNIFVIGYDQPGGPNPLNPDHTQLPRFQIGDFGVAELGRDLWAPTSTPDSTALGVLKKRLKVWKQREMAKPGFFLPEQFSVEWDQLDLDPDEGPSNAPFGTWPPWDQWNFPSGPGRYTSASNVWQIGMDMFCLLLLQRPDFPLVAGRMRSEEPAGVVPVPADQQRWTYGYRLIQNNQEGREHRQNFTPLLCETVAKCLMAKQEHRPDLITLQNAITAALGNPPTQPPDEVKDFFQSDPPPPLPRHLKDVDFDFREMDPFQPYINFDHADDVFAPPDPRPRRGGGRGRGRGRGGRRVPLEDRAYRP